MSGFDDILAYEPFALDARQKQTMLTEILSNLCQHHYDNCPEYRKMMDAAGFDAGHIHSYYDIPFLPGS